MQAAFIEAIKAGDKESVQEMLAADPTLANTQTGNGVSALTLSLYYGQTEVAALLRQHKSALDIFEAAALGDDQEVSRILAAQPELIDTFAADGFTPLGLAAYFGQFAVVALLVSQGADPNLPANNSQRVAPLHSAVARQDLAIARLLLSQGADANARQEQGVTALQAAAHRGQLAMVTLLLEHGADVHLVNDLGKSALDHAREDGHAAVVDYLTAYISSHPAT